MPDQYSPIDWSSFKQAADQTEALLAIVAANPTYKDTYHQLPEPTGRDRNEAICWKALLAIASKTQVPDDRSQALDFLFSQDEPLRTQESQDSRLAYAKRVDETFQNLITLKLDQEPESIVHAPDPIFAWLRYADATEDKQAKDQAIQRLNCLWDLFKNSEALQYGFSGDQFVKLYSLSQQLYADTNEEECLKVVRDYVKEKFHYKDNYFYSAAVFLFDVLKKGSPESTALILKDARTYESQRAKNIVQFMLSSDSNEIVKSYESLTGTLMTGDFPLQEKESYSTFKHYDLKSAHQYAIMIERHMAAHAMKAAGTDPDGEDSKTLFTRALKCSLKCVKIHEKSEELLTTALDSTNLKATDKNVIGLEKERIAQEKKSSIVYEFVSGVALDAAKGLHDQGDNSGYDSILQVLGAHQLNESFFTSDPMNPDRECCGRLVNHYINAPTKDRTGQYDQAFTVLTKYLERKNLTIFEGDDYERVSALLDTWSALFGDNDTFLKQIISRKYKALGIPQPTRHDPKSSGQQPEVA